MNDELLKTLILTELAKSLAWIVLPLLLALCVLTYRWWRRRSSGRPDVHVSKTALGAFSGGIAPEASAIAGFGMSARPQESLGELILRPSWGMRIYPFGLFALFYYLTDQMYVSGPMSGGVYVGPMDIGFVALLFVLILWCVIYFNFYDLRYDRDRIIHRSLLLTRREHDWSAVRSLRDDNAFFYVLRGTWRGKAYIPKHLAGIEVFILRLKDQIAANDRY
ncbi:MAG: hypothetical protein AAFU41_01680 [Pseudomonadota bacterium]